VQPATLRRTPFGILPIDGYCVPGPVRRFIFAVARPLYASAFVANKTANVAIDDVIIIFILAPDMYYMNLYIACNCYYYFKANMNIYGMINN
jgi:hypothetical protein